MFVTSCVDTLIGLSEGFSLGTDPCYSEVRTTCDEVCVFLIGRVWLNDLALFRFRGLQKPWHSGVTAMRQAQGNDFSCIGQTTSTLGRRYQGIDLSLGKTLIIERASH